MSDAGKQVLYRVQRYEPGVDQRPRFEEYHIPFTDGMTVLDGLWRIKETLDPSLLARHLARYRHASRVLLLRRHREWFSLRELLGKPKRRTAIP